MIIPDNWTDELSRALDPEAFAPVALHLSLTHRMGLAQQLSALGTTLNEVQADMAGGFASDRRHRHNGDQYYCLTGSRFEVFVESQQALSGRPLAVVTSVNRVQRLANRNGLRAVPISFHRPREEAICDVAAVHQELASLREQRRRQRQARDRAAEILTGTRVGDAGHTDLHAAARRKYSALLTVIDLLKERSDAQDQVRVSATVIDPDEVAIAADDPLVCVELARPVEALRQGLEVKVQSGGQSWTLEIVIAEDRLVCLELPERGELTPGARVFLEYRESFRLLRHSYALNRFLEEDVVGDWSALARLLCEPDTLAVPATRSKLTYFNADLNAGQRAAVAGAVDAPEAFFVQGPPGTGKTTVITEIVRQLTARGERVLLVASMHVAVDEVLRRVADVDGVFALRYTAVDAKVRDDLRRFLPEHVTTEFARRAARPARSKAPRWRAEIERLAAEEVAIRAALGARDKHRRENATHAETTAARDKFRSDWAASQAAADRAAALARQQVDQVRGHLMQAQQAERAMDAEVTKAKAGLGFWARVAAFFGFGPLRPLLRQYDAVSAVLANAQAQHETLATQAHRAIGQQQAVAHKGTAGLRLHDLACERSAGQARAAQETLRNAHDALRPILGDADPDRIDDGNLAALVAPRQARARRLGQFTKLEQRWHRIVGMHDQSPTGVEQVLTDLGDDLLQAANLVCCTATGFGGQRAIRESDFDTIIVDEASRVIDSEFLIGARQARRWILVGDEHQLPPYVHNTDEQHLHALAALHMFDRRMAPNLPAAVEHLGTLWREDEELRRFRTDPVARTAETLRDSGQWRGLYQEAFRTAYERLRQQDGDAERELLRAMRTHLVQSLFERCVRNCPPALRARLTEQRRMIDPIAALVREPVYGGDYSSPSEMDLLRHGVAPLTGQTLREPVVLLDTSNQPKAEEKQSGTGFVNEFEADWAVTVCRLWERELRRRGERDRVTVSVLTFYGAQAKLIRTRLGHPHYPDFRALKIEKVDSIDAIQGQESDLVLLSFCRTRRGRMGQGFGLWLQDVRRLNVACTRARRGLVLIGHRKTLARLAEVDEAKGFYKHLFGLFDRKSPGTVVLRELRSSE